MSMFAKNDQSSVRFYPDAPSASAYLIPSEISPSFHKLDDQGGI